MSLQNKIKSFFSINRKNPIEINNDWIESEIKVFNKNLIQVINWTSELSIDFDYEKGDYGRVFRKENPVINGKNLWKLNDNYAIWNVDHFEEEYYFELLKNSIKKRSKTQSPNTHFDFNNLGRILCFETCVSTVDGAPIIESDCFVDECDVPPIDTWFFLKKNYRNSNSISHLTLFCWIPKKFETNMQNAIDSEILGSYHWMDENDTEMFKKVKTFANKNYI